MRNKAIEEFKRDFIIKTLVQQAQFEQWLKYMFFLNAKLQEDYDIVYQDAFYVKLNEILSEGLEYATKVYNKVDNIGKTQWFSKIIDGFKMIKSNLNEAEFLYIEYRRHNASHIFQNQYEHIQDNLKIKKFRKGKSLREIDYMIKTLVTKYGSDRNIDEYLNKKIQPELTRIFESLTK